MAQQYYFLVSSLPALDLDRVPFFGQSEFLARCADWAGPYDLRYVGSASIRYDNDGTAPPPVSQRTVAARWSSFVREATLAASQVRAASLGWDVDKVERAADVSPATADAIRQIVNEESPLKVELAWTRFQWQTATQLEFGHLFDRDALYLYHIKLQLASRRQQLQDAELGQDEFDAQYNQIAEALMEIAT